MNASLRRVTFVLESESVEALSYVSERTGASMSAIVRDVLGGPIVQLATAMRGVPEAPTDAQLDLFRAQALGMANEAIHEARGVLGADLGVSDE